MPTRMILLTVLVFSLTGCQTPIKQAGSEHKTVTEKWYELSRYAESTLPAFGVKLTTHLSLVEEEGKSSYVLDGIQLAHQETPMRIDLLAPKFKNKFICTPVCMHLLEYERLNANKGKTLLNQYFDHHEFELFKFYGDIYLLNEQINQLTELEPQYVQEYLHYLVQKGETHDSLASFHEYLKQALAITEFRIYLENRNPLQQKLLLTNWWSEQGSINSNKEKLKWDATYGDEGVVAENVLWLLSKNKESEKWHSADEMAARNANIKNNQTRQSNWKTAIKEIVKPGDTVCSFNTNKIGTVKSREGNTVTVDLFGQAKKVVNGIIMNVDEGYFFGSEKNITFIPMQEKDTFSVNDIAVCHLS